MPSLAEIGERAAEARDILNDQVVIDSLRRMKERYVSVIAAGHAYDLTVRAACVKIQLLDEFVKELRSAVTEEKIQMRRRG